MVAAPREKRFGDGPRSRVPRVVRMYAARNVARPEALPVVHLGLATFDRKLRPARVASVADVVALLGGAAQSRADQPPRGGNLADAIPGRSAGGDGDLREQRGSVACKRNGRDKADHPASIHAGRGAVLKILSVRRFGGIGPARARGSG